MGPAPTPSKRVFRKKREVVKLLEQQHSSLMTIAKFCKLHNLSAGTFYKWKRKYGDDTPKGESLSNRTIKPRSTALHHPFSDNKKKFVPLLIPSETSRMSAEDSLFAEVGGIRIYQRVDASFLKSLLD